MPICLNCSHLLEEILKRECWKQERESYLANLFSLNFSPIELPNPLGNASFHVVRKNETYNAYAVLSARRKDSFSGISESLGKNFNEKESRFEEISKDGTGYLLDKNEKALLAIISILRNNGKKLRPPPKEPAKAFIFISGFLR